jgi:prepilin-type N-terminal cleavage/methylation domain-containing protein
MSNKKGFTMIEIIVVMVIIGVLAAIAVPNYLTFIEQGACRSAVNNLSLIAQAQKNYYFNKGTYYISPNPAANDLPSIDSTLNLNITDDYFSYWCLGTNYCFALRNPAVYQLYMNGSQAPAPTGWPATSNPTCTNQDFTGQCPSIY